MEQYANDRGPGQGVRGQSPHEAETHLAVRRLMEAANLPAFLIFEDIKNHRYLQSARFKIIFLDFSKIILSLTFP